MGFSLYTLFQAGLLCLNAVCVLNEERFLSKIGWSTQHGGFGEDPGMKIQVKKRGCENLSQVIKSNSQIWCIFSTLGYRYKLEDGDLLLGYYPLQPRLEVVGTWNLV